MTTFQEDACMEIIKGIEAINFDHFIFIPCSTVATIVEHFENKSTIRSYPVSREEDGIGIAAGISLGGKTPVVMIQDTGIGNSLLAITAFCQAYHVPMLILVTRRGGLGEINSSVQYFSEPLPRVLDDCGIQAFRLDYRVPVNEWSNVIVKAEKYSRDTHRPILVLFNVKGGREGS
jgi:sulfopyruvate decarboxylase subunit alpha